MRNFIDILTVLVMYLFIAFFLMASIDTFLGNVILQKGAYLNIMLFCVWWVLIYVIWAGIKDRK